jgi:cytosine/adenosine deaminase-related metal-dependent hydrolase
MNETESLRARIASLEAEISSLHKRRAAIEAMEAYKAHAATHAQEIADEAEDLLDQSGKNPAHFPRTAEYLRLRNEADRLRKEVLP